MLRREWFHHSQTHRKRFNYGELVADASKLELPTNVPLKKSEDYKILRKPMPRQDTPLKPMGLQSSVSIRNFRE
ncbi:MAG: hypothetical protein WDO15_16320 [Bacteroidota bacterium]